MRKIPNNAKTINGLFKNRSIPTGQIGFYNHPNFLEAEKADPQLLEAYAAYIEITKPNYVDIERNKFICDTLLKLLSEFLSQDRQTGTCIDVSMLVSKLLERYGVWNYCVTGSMNMHSSALKVAGNTTYFWQVDDASKPGHAWVCAPPYNIIDLSIKAQPYANNELDLLPDYIQSNKNEIITPKPDDHCSKEILQGIANQTGGVIPNDAHYRINPGMKSAGEYFSSRQITLGGLSLRYLVAGITLSDAKTVNDLESRKWNGKTAKEISEDVIYPRMSQLGMMPI